MNSDASAVLIQSIHHCLAAFEWPAQLSLEVVDYRESFRKLWEIDDRFLNYLSSKRSVLFVINSEAPEDPRCPSLPLSQNLSALDWAIAVSLKFIKKNRGESHQPVEVPWRIVLVDAAQSTAKPGSPRELFAHLASDDKSIFPWIKLVKAVDLSSLLPDLVDQVLPASQEHVESLVRNLWASELTQSNRYSMRHSLSNLIGPRVLAKAMGIPSDFNAEDPGVFAALDGLLEALELTPNEIDVEPAPWIARSQWERAGVKHWMLIDDMEDMGWSQFLKAALDLRDEEFTCFGQDSLKDIASIKSTLLRPFSNRAVLFLDLRLFARKTWQEEATFLKDLAGIAATYPVEHKQFVWPGFTSEDLQATQRCVGKSERVEDADYHTSLSLLPRILSHIAPTLPIILFSSTGRREIANRLRPYGNIVLDFMKPRISAEANSTVVHEARIRLTAAVQLALKLARGGNAYHLVLETLHTGRVSPPVQALERSVVEIYIDESEFNAKSTQTKEASRRFAVGGAVIYYPDQEAVKALDRNLLDRGLIWGLADDHPPLNKKDTLPKTWLPKQYPRGLFDYPYDPRLTEVLEAAKDASADIRIAAVGLVETEFSFKAQKHLPKLLREGAIDNLYRTMLQELINAILFDWLPYFASQVAEVRIDVATRLGTLDGAVNKENGLNELHTSYGIRAQRRVEGTFFSLGSDAVYPIVARSLAQNSPSIGKTRFTRARGTTLFDFDEKIVRFKQECGIEEYEKRITDTFRPKQIHFLADWMSRFAAQPRLIGPVGRQLFDSGFLQERNHQFRHLTAATLHSREGQVANCIFEAYQAVCFNSPDGSHYPLSRWQFPEIGKVLDKYRGQDFIDLVRLATGANAETKG